MKERPFHGPTIRHKHIDKELDISLVKDSDIPVDDYIEEEVIQLAIPWSDYDDEVPLKIIDKL